MTKFRDVSLSALGLLASTLLLFACGGSGGGGGGGGGGGSSPEFLQLMSEPAYGTMGSVNNVQSFNVMTPSATSLVGPNDFASAAAGDANFIQLQFTASLLASSVKASQQGGSDGIVIRDSSGNSVPYFLDATGALDPTNAFPAAGATPATLRLYFESSVTPGTPTRLAADKYSVSLLTANLRSATGRPFCAIKNDGLCLNQTNVVFHFTLDGRNRPISQPNAPLASGPTVALPLPSVAAIDDEIRLFLSDHVDFQSLVGFNVTTGRINVTSQDPFCSIPFAVNNTGAAGENIRVTYSPPGVSVLPANYGFVVYLANPFRDPTEVRIRFVDITPGVGAMPFDDPMGLIAGNGVPVFQNYSIGSAVWETARLGNASLTAPSDQSPTNGGDLELPPKLPLPGSSSLGSAGLTVLLLDAGNANATDSTAGLPTPDGILGVTDRARRPLAAPITVTWTLANGPVIANHPVHPDAHYVPQGHKLGGVDTSNVTISGTTGGTLGGGLNSLATPLDAPTVISSIDDLAYGAMLNPLNTTNNPPRRLNNAGIIMQGISVGVPFPPGGTPEASLTGATVNQPLGARLYIVDRAQGKVVVLNSHTFQPITTIAGLSSAAGVGMAPNRQFMYVSDFDSGVLRRVGTNPAQTSTFHQVVNSVPVGQGPTAVSVQPNNEDIFVINSLNNSLSIVDVPTQSLRISTPVGLGASDVFVTPRWTAAGATFAYLAFTPNSLSNSVTIYESDSPLLTVPNGADGKVLEERLGFQSPRGGIWNQNTGGVAGIASVGAWIANSQGSTVTHFGLTNMNLAPTPGFMGPPASRTFSDLANYSGNQSGAPTDVTIDAFTILSGTQRVLLVTYPSTGKVSAIDYVNGFELGSVTAPGTQIFGFRDQ